MVFLCISRSRQNDLSFLLHAFVVCLVEHLHGRHRSMSCSLEQGVSAESLPIILTNQHLSAEFGSCVLECRVWRQLNSKDVVALCLSPYSAGMEWLSRCFISR
jgi:hypothetical protein